MICAILCVIGNAMMYAACLLYVCFFHIDFSFLTGTREYQINIRLHELIQCAICLYNDKAVSTNGLGYNGSYTYVCL